MKDFFEEIYISVPLTFLLIFLLLPTTVIGGVKLALFLFPDAFVYHVKK